MAAPNFGKRPDGTSKGTGYLGILTNSNGDSVTEYSVGVNIYGQEIDVPTLVPTLTRDEVGQVLKATANDAMPPMHIIQKATEYATKRLEQGLPVFASPKDSSKAKKVRSNLGID